MGFYNKEECTAKLAPEARAFLAQMSRMPLMPINARTYVKIREVFRLMGAKRMERPVSFRGSIENRVLPGPGGLLPVRIFVPEGPGPFPVLLYFHGGGWVMGNILEMEDDNLTTLASSTPCVIVSVDYRLAPENPYPEARDDCYEALRWVAENAVAINGDSRRIAVSGESAGGNLAAVTALMSRDRGGPPICFQLLIYPATSLAGPDTESAKVFGQGFFLSQDDMEGVRSLYVPDRKDWTSPYVSPLLAEDLGGLPPALVITAGCDPLRDEGEAYAARLNEAGVPAELICFEDMIHAFLDFFPRSQSSLKALEAASKALRDHCN